MELSEEVERLAREVSSMTAGPASGHTAPSAGPGRTHTRLGRWAVVVAAVAAAVIAVGLAVFTIFGEGLGVLLSGGVMASFAAFVMAVVAMVKHERWALLWIPLSVFPAVL